MKRAEIPRFDREIAQLPGATSSFNDNVKLDAFLPSDMTYADKQRRGIHENSTSCESMRDHVRLALGEKFPLAAPIPLPGHIRDAALFTRDCPAEELVKFWDAQLSRLEKLVSDSKLAREKWNDRILPEIAPAAGKLQTVAVSQPTHHYGVGGAELDSLIFPWIPDQGNAFATESLPGGEEAAATCPEGAPFQSAPQCFAERAAKSGDANACPTDAG